MSNHFYLGFTKDSVRHALCACLSSVFVCERDRATTAAAHMEVDEGCKCRDVSCVCVCAFLVIFLVFVHSDQFIVHPVSTSIEHQSESIGHEGHLLGSSRTFQYVRRWGTFLVGFMGTSQIDE